MNKSQIIIIIVLVAALALSVFYFMNADKKPVITKQQEETVLESLTAPSEESLLDEAEEKTILESLTPPQENGEVKEVITEEEKAAILKSLQP